MRIFSLFLLFLAITVFPLSAQTEGYKPHIAVIPMKNSSDDTQYDSICERVTNTIELTLSLLDRYWIERVTDIDPISDLEKAKEYLKLKNYDNAIFGEAIKNPEDGSIILKCYVYDRLKTAITIEKSVKVENIFNVFNSSEQLITSVIENFAGIRIGFGSIRINNTGEKGSYTVFVDDSEVQTTEGIVEQVLIGNYTVKVVQNRMKGEYVLYNKSVRVNRNAETVIPIKIPYLLPEEEAELTALEETINSSFADPLKRGMVESAFAKIAALLSDVSFSERLQQKKTEYERLHEEYKKQYADIADEMFRVYIGISGGIPIIPDVDIFTTESYFDFGYFIGLDVLTEWGAFGIGFGLVHLNFLGWDGAMSVPLFTDNSPTAELRYTTLLDSFYQFFITLRIGTSPMLHNSIYLAASVGGILQFFDSFALVCGVQAEYFVLTHPDPTTALQIYLGVNFYF